VNSPDWVVTAYAESQGPGDEFTLGSVNVPVGGPGLSLDEAYSAKLTVAANTLNEENPGNPACGTEKSPRSNDRQTRPGLADHDSTPTCLVPADEQRLGGRLGFASHLVECNWPGVRIGCHTQPLCWRLYTRASRARTKIKRPPVIWIITLLLILGASAAVVLRIDALTPDKPAEPPLAQRWKAMGGG
jgi:hypothetical protein